MPTFQTYNVTPILPAALEPLREMSFNLWWTWEPSARRLFRHLDPELWDRTNHNPVRMLQLSRQSRLEELAQDKGFVRELKQVLRNSKSISDDTIPTERPAPAARLKIPLRISLPNLVFTSRSRITPAAWASSLATIANRPVISI